MRVFVVLLFASVFLAACAQPQQSWTRQQAEQTTVRTLPGVDAKAALEAAEALFRLSDPNDVSFEFPPNELRVKRSFIAYYVLASASGSYDWIIHAKDVPEGSVVRVSAYANIQGGSATMTPVIGGSGVTVTPTTSPVQGSYLQRRELYDLFWSRLGYLLSDDKPWVTCDEAEAATNASPLNSPVEALCLNADDNKPV